jgi:hypothetical protein
MIQEHSPPPKNEKEWLEREMAGFDPQSSVPWIYLSHRYGHRISKEEIISLGQVCAIELNIVLVRDFKRRKETMLKWFSKHWDTIRPFLDTRLQVLGDKHELRARQAQVAAGAGPLSDRPGEGNGEQ